jgi:hypothetical protein
MTKPSLLVVVLAAALAAPSGVSDPKSYTGIQKPVAAEPAEISGSAIVPAARAHHSHAGPVSTRAIDQRYIRLRADASAGRRADTPRLISGSNYAGPADPTNPSGLAICNPAVLRALGMAWSSSFLASHRPPVSENNKVEYGFAIDADPAAHLLAIGSMGISDLTGNRPNELMICISSHTIATVHTHNIGTYSAPSATDAAGDLPAFVKSQFHLYVTIPGTGTYAEVDLQKACNARL